MPTEQKYGKLKRKVDWYDLFGYVKPLPGEMLVKEFELYKAIYCGLCRTGGKKVSRLTRFFLSYDFTALAALRLALTDEEQTVIRKRCPYNLKKKSVLVCDGVLTYVAAAFACLSYCKACDDLEDEKGMKKFRTRLLMPVFRRMKKKADRLFPTLYQEVSKPLKELGRLESEKTAGGNVSLDAMAHGAAEAVAVIAAFGLDGSKAAIAHEAGYHIGRYIYIIDAADDLQKDEKLGRFNPIALHYGSAEAAREHTAEIDATLEASAVRFSAAVGLAEDSHYTSILQNIARFGMDKTVETVYDKYSYKRKENKEL